MDDEANALLALRADNNVNNNNHINYRNRKRGRYNKQTSDQDRELIIRLHINNGMSNSEICTALNNRVKVETIRSIIQTFKKTGRQSKKVKAGKQAIYTEEDRKIICDLQDQHPEYTYKQLREEWKDLTGNYEKKMNDHMIRSIMKEFNFTTKNLEIEPEGRNTPEAIEFRKNYCLQAASWNNNEIVFIDEKGFNLHTRRRRGRSRKGTKALIPAKNSKGTNISICAAISPVYGVMHYQIEIGSFDREKYLQFLSDLMKHHAFHSRTMRIIMDNVRFHQGELVREVIEQQQIKHLRQFQPPYSPHINAIEYCFSQWAMFVNRHPKNSQTELLNLIKQAVSATTIANCEGWMHEVTRYYILCAAGQPLKYQPPVQHFGNSNSNSNN